MPWTAKTFKKHNRKLSGHALDAAAAASTNALKHGYSEGAAVRIGNAVGNRLLRSKHAKKKG